MIVETTTPPAAAPGIRRTETRIPSRGEVEEQEHRNNAPKAKVPDLLQVEKKYLE
jgi:hypothetical protein